MAQGAEEDEGEIPDSDGTVLDSLRQSGGVFVAGTDTGVGKTIVTAGLTGWLREDGVDARAIKPAQTGAPEDDDAAEVAAACDDPDASTCLRRIGPALAPRVAAERADVQLSYEDLLDDSRQVVEDAEFAVVEGIGGLRVPLADKADVLDLAADLALPAIVVARSGLGTLNHTALTVDALRDRGIDVHLAVLNEYDGATVPERTNPGELRRMLDLPIATLSTFDTGESTGIVPQVAAALAAADAGG